MSKNIDTLVLLDNESNKFEVAVKEYSKNVLTELNVQPQTYEEDGESRKVTPEIAFKHIFGNLSKGNEADQVIKDLFPDLLERISSDLKIHAENTKETKQTAEEKKAEKEAADAKKKEEEEKKAAELAKKQGEVAVTIEAGLKQADSEFLVELQSFKEALPEGVEVVGEGGGYGLRFAEGTTKETLGNTLGYMVGRSRNSEAMQNQAQFWIGDIVRGLVAQGVYATGKEAGAAVKSFIGDDKSYSESAISYYTKMAERTPIPLRNPHADPTAYLAIANMKLPTKGKDGNEKETEAEFLERKQKFEKGREELQKKVAEGEYKKRKDVLEPVQEVLKSVGLAKKETEGEQVNITAMLKQYFHAQTALDNLIGSHSEGVAIYADGDKKYTLSQEELEGLRDEAQAKLNTVYYSDKKASLTLRDYSRGKVTRKKKVATKDKGVQEEEYEVPVYPEPFWDVKAAEEAAKAAAGETKEPAAAGA